MTAPTEKAAPIPAEGLVDAIAKAISSHGYTEQVKGDGFAWWWNSLHDHPGNVFAHECREDDRAKARLALGVIMQDREARPSLPDSREERASPTGDLVRLYYEYDRIPDWFTDKRRAAHKEFREAMSAAIDEAGLRARQGGNNG